VRAPLLAAQFPGLASGAVLAAAALLTSCGRGEPSQHGQDPHARVRPLIQADTSIQALRPPAEAFVWYQASPDGRLLAAGRDTSRVALIEHARALGKVTLQGSAPPGTLAPVRVFYAWVEVPARP
jgi:hypothetical protein